MVVKALPQTLHCKLLLRWILEPGVIEPGQWLLVAVRVAGTCLSRLLPGFLDGQSFYSSTNQPPESRNTRGPVRIWCLVLAEYLSPSFLL